MKRYKTNDYKETNKNSKIKKDNISVVLAVLLYISFGVLLTIGNFLCLKSELKSFFDISYADYGMFLFTILAVSELWALFIQIPSIKGYNKSVISRWDSARFFLGIIILIILIITSIGFFTGPQKGGVRLLAAKFVYKLDHYSDNDFEEQLAMIDEIINRGETTAEQFAKRGKIYLDIAKIKDDGTEEYKYSLPDDTSEQCYKKAIEDFNNAITQDGEVAEYYYLKGRAEYSNRTSAYSVAKDDFQKAIELNDTVPDYYFYCAKAWYGISISNADSDEAVQNALNNIESAIQKYIKENDFDEESADESDNVNEDKTLAEYYYYAGLINSSMESDKSLQKAIENCRKATIYDSENAEYFSELGIAYDASNDLSKAESAFDHAISIDKVNSDYDNEAYHLTWKAYVIQRAKRIDEAIEVYEESLKLKEDTPYPYRKLAELYKEKDDDVSVKNVYNRAIKNCRDKAEFYYECGRMYYSGYDYNNSIEYMEKAMENDGAYTADAYYYIGCSYHLLQDYNEAYRYYQLAKDNDSDRSDEIDRYMEDCFEHMEK